ncbi:hypothetical protein P4S68_11870 [Pseudoalteromonas sp. Hal099]
MSEKFVVQLSEQAAPSHWGENAALSFNEQGATVHLSEQETLKNVQKAARTIASQGVKQVELAGDTWCSESQWAFYQGFVTPKSLHGVEFVDNAQSDLNELAHLKASATWAREMVNGCSR